MPRPPKTPDEKLEEIVRVRFTKEQRIQLQSAADHEERDLSDWLRRLALREAARVNERASKRAARTK